MGRKPNRHEPSRRNHGDQVCAPETDWLAALIHLTRARPLVCREDLESCSSREQLGEHASRNDAKLAACMAEMRDAYDRGDLSGFAMRAARHRYLVKIEEEIQHRLDQASYGE